MASTYISADSAREAFGFTWRTLAKERLSRATSSLLGAALQHLAEEGAARRQNVLGEIERRLDQAP